MCGIAGLVYRDPARPAPPALVRRMCDAIRHRGPDDEGIFASGQAGLGMRRLSIIDLAGGHQPIFNEDRTKVIVFNGEIYNYAELRRELIAKGHAFTTNSDTETILHLYEEMGPRCVERLRGMFGFAIWDTAERTLFVARDRFGIKPMYIVQQPWGIAFASELKALVAAGLTSRALDWSALDAYFQLGYIPAPASPFLDVRKLEPGHTLEWRPGSGAPRMRAYWDLPRERREAPADVEERVRAWIDESVKAHLVSDVPVAALLSGGMDSSAVVSSMAMAGVTPHAFTARYQGSGAEAADESGLARLLADRYGAKLTVVDVAPKVRDLLEPMVRALDEPHADESAVPTWLISEAVARDYKVVLSGTGGDELFAGYRRHLGLLAGEAWHRLPGVVQRGAAAVANALPEPRGGGLGVDRLKRFVRTVEGDAPDRFLGYFSRLPDEARMSLYGAGAAVPGAGAARDRFRAAWTGGGSPAGLSAGLYLDYKTYLPDDILALSDRISMAHSLEVRVPFVDHVLVEAVFPLPDRVKIGAGRAKKLLRDALRTRLPEAHFSAPKRGFGGPTAAWLRHALRDMLVDELSPERVKRLGLFEPGAVSGLLDDHLSRRHNREGILWELLCFLTWHRVYVEPATVAEGQVA